MVNVVQKKRKWSKTKNSECFAKVEKMELRMVNVVQRKRSMTNYGECCSKEDVKKKSKNDECCAEEEITDPG